MKRKNPIINVFKIKYNNVLGRFRLIQNINVYRNTLLKQI